jgi:predicted TIM-barrel fold metal-dependent hydrolase
MATPPMLSIDAQVHAYERDHPGRPWAAVLHGPAEVTGDDMVKAMDAVGVDGALLVSPFTMYRYDASYAIQVRAKHPGRFALIKPVDPADPGVADTIAEWKKTPGTVAIRIMMTRGVSEDAADPGLNRVLASAARHGLPVNLLCWGRLAQARELAARNPSTSIVIDHLGLQQPFEPPPPAQPWADLPAVLALGALPNVAIKITGACTLSREAYPYKDIWDPLARIFDAFGINRCLWGTDWTRAVGLLTYKQGVDAFRDTDRLSESDKRALLGEALQRVYRWSPTRA